MPNRQKTRDLSQAGKEFLGAARETRTDMGLMVSCLREETVGVAIRPDYRHKSITPGRIRLRKAETLYVKGA